jgi:putative ABC transport system permease protein
MIQMYLKIALRNFSRNKTYSFINILGLAVGMACCLLLVLFVRDELSFDRQPTNAPNIYRVNVRLNSTKEAKEDRMPITSFPIGPTLAREMPEVKRVVRVNLEGDAVVALGERKFVEKKMLYADNGYFQMFALPFVAGSPASALAEPFSVVLTEEMARKYFGDENPMGKTLRVDNSYDYKITGVVRNLPHTMHLRFDFMASMKTLTERWRISNGAVFDEQWFAFTTQHTYVQLHEGVAAASLTQKLPALFARQERLATILRSIGATFAVELQPLADIHLYPLEGEIQPQGSMKTLYVFSVIGLIVLAIACINFMNLATARSAQRAKEVGLRKVLGAQRRQLVMQFLGEAVIISGVALCVALVLVELALPAFNSFTEKTLAVGYWSDMAVVLGFVALALATGFISGSYPAFVLSGFSPLSTIKGKFTRSAAGAALRKSLVVVQFSVSIILIVATAVVFKQLEYTQAKNLGFNKEQLLMLSLPTDAAFAQRIESAKAALKNVSGVVGVAATNSVPGSDAGVSRNPAAIEGAPSDKNTIITLFTGDEDFIPTMGMTMAAGRNFSRAITSDASDAFVINEAAATAFGLGSDPIGKRLEWRGGRTLRKGTVIGVVKDFHFESLHAKISPVLFFIDQPKAGPFRAQQFVIRLQTKNIQATMTNLQSAWQHVAPNALFDYKFVDKTFEQLYNREQRIGTLVAVFAGLAIFIACLGLFGLAAFTAEQRTKEIGIRKVLGATDTSIVALLSKDFLQLVVLAFVVACPLAWYGTNRWLEDFAYRVELKSAEGIAVFAAAGVMAGLIAFVTVAWQAWQVARANPVNALRSE